MSLEVAGLVAVLAGLAALSVAGYLLVRLADWFAPLDRHLDSVGAYRDGDQ